MLRREPVRCGPWSRQRQGLPGRPAFCTFVTGARFGHILGLECLQDSCRHPCRALSPPLLERSAVTRPGAGRGGRLRGDAGAGRKGRPQQAHRRRSRQAGHAGPADARSSSVTRQCVRSCAGHDDACAPSASRCVSMADGYRAAVATGVPGQAGHLAPEARRRRRNGRRLGRPHRVRRPRRHPALCRQQRWCAACVDGEVADEITGGRSAGTTAPSSLHGGRRRQDSPPTPRGACARC
jgi:hypothetical protein